MYLQKFFLSKNRFYKNQKLVKNAKVCPPPPTGPPHPPPNPEDYLVGVTMVPKDYMVRIQAY